MSNELMSSTVMPSTWIALRRRVLALAAVSLGGCGGDSAEPTAPPVGEPAAIRVDGNPIITAIGDSTKLTATVVDRSGQPMPDQPVTASLLVRGATLSLGSGGWITAIGSGMNIVIFRAGTLQTLMNVEVRQTPARIESTLSSVELSAVGDSAFVGATAWDRNGNIITLASITWSTSAPAIVALSPVGSGTRVRSLARGTATLTAASGDVRRVLAVRVGSEAVRSMAGGAP